MRPGCEEADEGFGFGGGGGGGEVVPVVGGGREELGKFGEDEAGVDVDVTADGEDGDASVVDA